MGGILVLQGFNNLLEFWTFWGILCLILVSCFVLEGVNGYCLCLAGSWERWLKCLHQIPSVSWMFHFHLHVFLTLPSPLVYLICAKDITIVLLLQMMGWMKRLAWRGPGSFMLKFGLWGKGWDWNSLYILFCFCAVVNCFSWLVHDSCSINFFVPFLRSLSGPFN